MCDSIPPFLWFSAEFNYQILRFGLWLIKVLVSFNKDIYMLKQRREWRLKIFMAGAQYFPLVAHVRLGNHQ